MRSFSPWVNVEMVIQSRLFAVCAQSKAERRPCSVWAHFSSSQHTGGLRRQSEKVADPRSGAFHLHWAAPGHQGGQPAGGHLPSWVRQLHPSHLGTLRFSYRFQLPFKVQEGLKSYLLVPVLILRIWFFFYFERLVLLGNFPFKGGASLCTCAPGIAMYPVHGLAVRTRGWSSPHGSLEPP